METAIRLFRSASKKQQKVIVAFIFSFLHKKK